MTNRIYLDHNAGAPACGEALEAMIAVLESGAANPSSAHREGARARRYLTDARADVAALIGARPADVVFTSGATEANNLALRGAPVARGGIVTTAIEHASVLETARDLARDGRDLVEVPPDSSGRVSVEAVLESCTSATGLVSVGLANGEVGSIAPVPGIAAGVGSKGSLVHTDAAQAAGRIAVDVTTLGVDLLSLSSHKIGGPSGIGALWVRPGLVLRPQVTGGTQERSRRAGTENVAAAVGFGVAARRARTERTATAARMCELRDRLWSAFRAAIPDGERHGPVGGDTLPNTLNVRFPGCAGESLLVLLDLAGVAVSLGSACGAGAAEPSHVLLAMGLGVDAAREGVRFSLGPTTTREDVEAVARLVPELVRRVREGIAA